MVEGLSTKSFAWTISFPARREEVKVSTFTVLINGVPQIRVRHATGGWRVDELVTPGGEYITWPELYSSRESALADALKVRGLAEKDQLMSRWNGRNHSEDL